MRRRLFLLSSLAFATILPTPVHAQFSNACPSGVEKDISTFNARIAPAIYQVLVQDAQGSEADNGTATLIDRRGYFLTAGHVVDQYADPPDGKIRLRRSDGKIVSAVVKRNFMGEGVDLAVVKVDEPLPLPRVAPVPLRISNPFGAGAFTKGFILAYHAGGATISVPREFSIGGQAGDASSMTLGFAAVGGNSGALLLEPNGRAFGMLTAGPDPSAMEIPIYVPATLVPSRQGKFAIPEIPITIVPENFQSAVAAASVSKALPVSAFWDRLAAAIPPSDDLEAVIKEIRSSGWRSAAPMILSDDGSALTAIDMIHLYRTIANDSALTVQTFKSFTDLINVVSGTCSSDALETVLIPRVVRLVAKIGIERQDVTADGKLERTAASQMLTWLVRSVATGVNARNSDVSDLREIVSDLALVEANRLKLGEVDFARVVSLVSVAEGLGGTPSSGELAGLIAYRGGDQGTGAAFLALADARLREKAAREQAVSERRSTIQRVYGKIGGPEALGAEINSLTLEHLQSLLMARAQTSLIAATLTSQDLKSSLEAAGSIH